MNKRTLTAALVLASATIAQADSGPYIGVSAGGVSFDADLGDVTIPGLPTSLDEDDTGFEVFGGYIVDLPFIDIGVEIGYVDFGEPEINVLNDELTFETTGINAWGILGTDLGPIDVFGKLGVIAWEVDAALGTVSDSEDGTDIGYGLGAAFGLGPVQVRAEYEIYDLDDTDVEFVSVGLLYRF